MHTEVPIATRLELASQFLQRQRTTDAQQLLHGILAQQPDHYRATCMMAQVYNQLEQFKEALQWAKKAIALDPSQVGGYTLQTEIYVYLSRAMEAYRSAATALKIDPSAARPLYLRGWAALYLPNAKAAEADLIADTLLQNYPGINYGFALKGDVAVQRQQLPEAAYWYKEGLRLTPSDPYLTNRLAEVLADQDAIDSAAQLTSQLLQNDPSSAAGQQLLSHLLKTHHLRGGPGTRLGAVGLWLTGIFLLYAALGGLLLYLAPDPQRATAGFIYFVGLPLLLGGLYPFFMRRYIATQNLASSGAAQFLLSAWLKRNALFTTLLLLMWLGTGGFIAYRNHLEPQEILMVMFGAPLYLLAGLTWLYMTAITLDFGRLLLWDLLSSIAGPWRQVGLALLFIGTTTALWFAPPPALWGAVALAILFFNGLALVLRPQRTRPLANANLIYGLPLTLASLWLPVEGGVVAAQLLGLCTLLGAATYGLAAAQRLYFRLQRRLARRRLRGLGIGPQ